MVIFSIVKRPINQDVLFNQIYKLFDQSSFAIDIEEDNFYEVRENEIHKAISSIIKKIDKLDKSICLDYFFSPVQISLNTLAQKHKISKSTAHYKIKKFTTAVSENFKPLNEKEGVIFMEKLHKFLDDL